MKISPALILAGTVLLTTGPSRAMAQVADTADPLSSWNDTDTRQAIIAFVEKVTAEGTPDFVPPDERIATFDNDGTLWCEKPMYVQLRYTIDRVKALETEHPEWKTTEPFASLLKGDIKGVAASGKEGLMALLAATHTGMTIDEFDQVVTEWISTARHPTTGRLYTEMVYQPMLDLLAYLRDNGFKTFIVSGGGIEFMRPWAQRVYGIPPEQVVGSSGKLKFELRDGIPVLVKLAEIDLIDDKAGKPVGIQSHIGRRPIFAAGNSDGDLQMLQFTTIARSDGDTTPRMGIIIHHTDAVREYAYDRDSEIGRLDVALDQAPERGWTVVNMKNDWKQIWPEATATPSGGEKALIGEWRVEDIGGKGVVDNSHSTLQIAADGAATGDGGVNRYRGQATIDDSSLTFSPLVATRRAGPPALMDQETNFLGALSKVKSYRIAETGLLSLLDEQGNELVRLSKVEATALVGEWRVEDIGGKGVVDDSNTTLKVAADGSVSGDSGVNRYNGPATIDGASLSFGLLAATMRAGPPALMDQETNFFEALGKVKSYRIAPTGVLSLLDGEGNELVRLSPVEPRE